MTKEEQDFQYFKENQLVNVDFSTGKIDVMKRNNKGEYSLNCLIRDVGSANEDGYQRVYCNGSMRMKHRLIYWLYHGEIPNEVDHLNKQRSDNSITNLQKSNRSQNTTGTTVRTFKQLTKAQVILIAQRYATNQEDFNITHVAKEFGKSRTQIKAIISKKYWSHITDQFF